MNLIRQWRVSLAALTLAMHLFGAAHAEAEDAKDVSALIRLVEKRPSGQDRDLWREQRREHVRVLGELGDTKAVPALIRIAKEEQFDAVGEIAVVALGKLGDKRAKEVLLSIANDSSRDRFVRQSARDALSGIGEEVADPTPLVESQKNSSIPADGDAAAFAGKEETKHSSPAVPKPDNIAGAEVLAENFSRDTIAAFESLQFGLADSAFSYDGPTKRSDFRGQIEASYRRVDERERLGLQYTGRASLVSGVQNTEGADSSSRLATASAQGAIRARFYFSKRPLFALAGASMRGNVDHIRVNRMGPENTTKENLVGADFGLRLGLGYGRVLMVGDAMRLERIAAIAARRGLLGRALTPELKAEVLAAWWGLRREQGFHDRLLETVRILKEAGVFLREPSASESYAIIQVLRDGQFATRREGLQGSVAIAESVALRDDDLGLEEGRREALEVDFEYRLQQLPTNREYGADVRGYYRVLEEDDERKPWAIQVTGGLKDYYYSANSDPIGALDLSVGVGASNAGQSESEGTVELLAKAGWEWSSSRASQYRVGLDGRLSGAEVFLSLSFSGRYGLIDASYVGATGGQ